MLKHNIRGLQTFASISALRKQVCSFQLAPFILHNEMYVLSSREFLIARLSVCTQQQMLEKSVMKNTAEWANQKSAELC